MNNKKVGIYIRKAISNKFDVEGIKEKAINSCKQSNWEVFNVYIDDGYSGINMDRPDLKRMLDDAKNKDFDILFVNDGSMLSRIQKDTLYIFEILKENNISVMSIKQGKVFEITYDNVVLEVAVADAVREEIQEQVSSELQYLKCNLTDARG